MINILLRLFAAHVIADFFLQFDIINYGKYEKGYKGIFWILLHGLIHGGVTYLCLSQWDNYFIPLFIFVFHTLTDWLKVIYTHHKNTKNTHHKNIKNGYETVTFLFDQCIHCVFLVLSIYLYRLIWNQLPVSNCIVANKFWAVAIAYMIILKPSGIFISLHTKRWRSLIHSNKEDVAVIEGEDDSLAKAGAWIGYCERLIALTCVLMNCVQGIGFLLAAKSIFRFGNLKDGRETKLTEYVLLGSLLSMAIASCVGYLLSIFLFNYC